jgi:hypothetical protein
MELNIEEIDLQEQKENLHMPCVWLTYITQMRNHIGGNNSMIHIMTKFA